MNAPSTSSAPELWRRALARGAEWRYVVLFVVTMFAPTALAMAPIHAFFKSLFDGSTRAHELVSALDSSALTEVVRQLGEPGAEAIPASVFGVLLTTAIVAPMLAGAALTLAKKTGPLGFRALLAGAGDLYARMLRTAIASSIPLGIAGGGAALAFHFADKAREGAIVESSATRASLLATIASVLLFWLANVTVETGRAHFGAEPERRSALLAWWSGVRLLVRRPGRVLGLSIMTTIVGVGVAAVLTAVRLRIPQAGGASIVVAFIVAQLAVAALAWGRSSQLVGLVELIKAEDES